VNGQSVNRGRGAPHTRPCKVVKKKGGKIWSEANICELGRRRRAKRKKDRQTSVDELGVEKETLTPTLAVGWGRDAARKGDEGRDSGCLYSRSG